MWREFRSTDTSDLVAQGTEEEGLYRFSALLVHEVAAHSNELVQTELKSFKDEKDVPERQAAMKATIRYLAGIAGPSGFGSNTTAEQVTLHSSSSSIPFSHLIALITGNYIIPSLRKLLSSLFSSNFSHVSNSNGLLISRTSSYLCMYVVIILFWPHQDIFISFVHMYSFSH